MILASILAVIITGCRETYNPPAITAPDSYLVVEGTINSGADSTIFRLSRTVNLSATNTSNPERLASVTVESDAGAGFKLAEIRDGYYVTEALNLDNSKKYRLRIETTDSREYLSDFVPVTPTPPIDSVGFTVLNNAMQIYVNTHDPANKTHYYRWSYEETWKFHAQYVSDYITDGAEIIGRRPNQQIYYCFTGDVSSDIVLGSSAKLTQDIIYQAPLTQVAPTSEKIELEYSILVHQYALTADAFKFWGNLRQNTENLGGIFSRQPSQVNGNIHCTSNPAEPVVGYVSASTAQSKRIFISSGQLPLSWRPSYPYTCSLDSVLFSDPKFGDDEVAKQLIPIGGSLIPTQKLYINGMPAGFLASYIECVDCSIRGTKIQPVFWKE